METPLGRLPFQVFCARTLLEGLFILPHLEKQCLMLGKWEKIDIGHLVAPPHGNSSDGSIPACLHFASFPLCLHGFSLGGCDSSFLPQSKDTNQWLHVALQ